MCLLFLGVFLCFLCSLTSNVPGKSLLNPVNHPLRINSYIFILKNHPLSQKRRGRAGETSETFPDVSQLFSPGFCLGLSFCYRLTFTVKRQSLRRLQNPSEDGGGVLRDAASWIGLRDYPWMRHTIEGMRAGSRHFPVQRSHFPN